MERLLTSWQTENKKERNREKQKYALEGNPPNDVSLPIRPHFLKFLPPPIVH
jgi:hypothetical protein